MDAAKVAIVGFGAIGTGVARMLLEGAGRIAQQAGKRLELAAVVDIDLKRPRSVALPPGLLTADLKRVTDDPAITVVAETIRGTEAARGVVLELLQSGKDVVTANKALLAAHGPELFARARQLGRTIAFEAAIGGGIPIVSAITDCLTSNQLESIHAILNATSNFILSQMEENDCEYETALAEAQQRGYALVDPALDLGGGDAAQKLAVLAHLAFGARIEWQKIPRTGIEAVDVTDIRYARELGYSVKLLAVAEMHPDGLELHVSPTLVRRGALLAEVRGAYNAFRLLCNPAGKLFFYGLGAGQMPTASAVVSDLINTITGRTAISFRTLNFWPDLTPPPRLRDPSQASSRFYLRLNVEDRPGVMAEITAILGRHNVSIASVIQHEVEEDAAAVVPLMIMTHSAPEGQVSAAMKAIGQLACVHPGSVRMRVRE
jgi:homoserine dehydrogenase